MDCIPRAKDRGQWRVVLNTATNPGLPTKVRNPSTRYATTAFSRTHQLFVTALHYWLFLSVRYYLKTSLVYSKISNNLSSLQKVNSHSACQGILTLVYQLNIQGGNWTSSPTKPFYSATAKQYSPNESHITRDFTEYTPHATSFWQRPRLQYRQNTARHTSYSRWLS